MLKEKAINSGLIELLVGQVLGAVGYRIGAAAARKVAIEFLARLPESQLKSLIVTASVGGVPFINVAMGAWQIYSITSLILDVYQALKERGEIAEQTPAGYAFSRIKEVFGAGTSGVKSDKKSPTKVKYDLDDDDLPPARRIHAAKT
jgi:hypothetical protein